MNELEGLQVPFEDPRALLEDAAQTTEDMQLFFKKEMGSWYTSSTPFERTVVHGDSVQISTTCSATQKNDIRSKENQMKKVQMSRVRYESAMAKLAELQAAGKKYNKVIKSWESAVAEAEEPNGMQITSITIDENGKASYTYERTEEKTCATTEEL